MQKSLATLLAMLLSFSLPLGVTSVPPVNEPTYNEQALSASEEFTEFELESMEDNLLHTVDQALYYSDLDLNSFLQKMFTMELDSQNATIYARACIGAIPLSDNEAQGKYILLSSLREYSLNTYGVDVTKTESIQKRIVSTQPDRIDISDTVIHSRLSGSTELVENIEYNIASNGRGTVSFSLPLYGWGFYEVDVQLIRSNGTIYSQLLGSRRITGLISENLTEPRSEGYMWYVVNVGDSAWNIARTVWGTGTRYKEIQALTQWGGVDPYDVLQIPV